MATVTVHHPPDRLAALLEPRDDLLVAEAADPAAATGAGHHAFVAIDGPFTAWTREVHAHGDHVVETIRYRTTLGVWEPLFRLPLRRAVRRGLGGAHPWWLPPDRLDPRGTRTLAAACALAVLGGFLAGQLTQTLTFAAAEFHAQVAEQTRVLMVVRIGALVTLAGTAFADRRGRRPIAVGSLLLAGACSFATAVAPNLAWLTALQLVSRSAAVIGVILLPVITSEELPAGSRGFATGLLAMAGGLGVGGAILLLRLADVHPPTSWRWCFAVAGLSIPLVVFAGRRLPETRRFERLAAVERSGGAVARWSRSRLAAMCAALFALNAFVTPTSQLQNEYLRTARGFDGGRITLFLLATNSLGGLGIVLGGRLADRRGRHLVATIGLVGIAVGNAAMFSTSGWPMWGWSVVGSAVGAACIPALGVLNPELFPTARRGAAAGVLNGAGVLGAVTGLFLAGRWITGTDYGPTITMLALAPLAVIGLLRLLPETARVALEDLNPGDVTPSSGPHPGGPPA